MRLQYVYVAVLAVFALVAGVNASSVGTEPRMANPNAHLDRALTEGLSDLRTKRLLGAGESNEDEERGAIANFFAKLSKLGKWKKIDPNKLPKVDLKKSPKVDGSRF
ncbi:hypothetical protein JG687_00008979 [Phytophthora cactorum]|uniref:RxLR effector protein n=1 Tax=Phytophthora cactorum TaxID=29920 RepID=A0A8T1UAY8_9STRA|nr:hypothetical protein PC121_g13579 [Phytophthora cactorum]KAG4054964.1 hypothetical protein PC123_g9920 [Phytophthora cactorum]KAG6959126.1 hypothetical protein JG687_00008979 [Phytophthora cactorum]